MILAGLSLVFFSLFLVSFITFTNSSFLSTESVYFSDTSAFLPPIPLGLSFNFISVLFCSMVVVVSFLVYQYSEFYMGFYNNKKFSLLLISFVGSMVIMSTSWSFLNLMIGWDYLGLTSLCLIMFYPNKFTMFNSSMTMFFNRMGDVLMVWALSICYLNGLVSFVSILESMGLSVILVSLCALTKSAQFPLSSWLPAAMSAPTPISAMVHSSTLVTAGIFIVMTFQASMDKMNLIYWLLCPIFFLSFTLGGLLGNLEKDLKKVIAFSTMSQISMILLFCCIKAFPIAMVHMISHATFKSLLFCGAGAFFTSYFMSQNYQHLKMVNKNLISTQAIIMVSLFSMTGLCFSSSFYTKDTLIEFCHDKSSWVFILLIFSASLTVMYSSKLMQPMSFSENFLGPSLIKNYSSKSTILYTVLTMLAGILLASMAICSFFPLEEASDILLATSILVTFALMSKKESKLILYISSSLFYMKHFSYSWLSLAFSKTEKSSFLMSDSLFFKPSLYKDLENYSLSVGNVKGFILIFFLTFLLFFIY